MTRNRCGSLSLLSATETKHMSLYHHLRSLLIASLTLLALLFAGSSSAARADEASVFEVQDFTARALDSEGNDYTVAGGHPYEGLTSFSFPTRPAAGTPVSVEPPKSTFVELPPGFLGNLAGTKRCPLLKLTSNPSFPECPVDSQVGTLRLDQTGNLGSPFRLFNMVPERGYPAELGFKYLNSAVVLYPRLRSRSEGYGVTVATPGVADFVITGAEARLFGVPSQHPGLFGSPPVGGPPIPVLSNLSDCLVAEPVTRIIVDSWRQPGRLAVDGFPDLSDGRWKSAVAPAPPVTGCDAPGLVSQFAPHIDARPTPEVGITRAGAPSGYAVDLNFPQSNDATDSSATFDPSIPAAPPLKDATVILPEGVAVSQ
jgi:hypothetical protein